MSSASAKIDRYPMAVTGAGTNLNWTASLVDSNMVFQEYPVAPNASFQAGCSLGGAYDASSQTFYYTYLCQSGTEEKETLPNCTVQTVGTGETITCPALPNSALVNAIKAGSVEQNYQEDTSQDSNNTSKLDYSWLWILVLFIFFVFIVYLVSRNR